MSTFIDTSANLPVVDRSESRHALALESRRTLILAGDTLITTNYVLLETIALIQRRFGLLAVTEFDRDFRPSLEVVWVLQSDHQNSLREVLIADRRQLSLVDCVSFVVMRRLGIRQVFCFDPHFREQGFECIPSEMTSEVQPA